jgi:hypothetical protein
MGLSREGGEGPIGHLKGSDLRTKTDPDGGKTSGSSRHDTDPSHAIRNPPGSQGNE